MNLSPVARSRTFPFLIFLGIVLGLVLPMTEARADYFYTVTPCRAYDSRPGKPDAPQLDNSKRTIKLTGRCGVPADASAVAANVTLVGASGEGHIVVFQGPAGQSQPNPPVGTIPFRKEQTIPARANNVFIGLADDGSGTINILPVMTPPGAKLGVIIDVVGFFRKSPIAVDDTATVAEDSGATTINVRANDLAAGSPAFSIQSVTQPANGTVAITNGGQDLTYTPNANYCNTPPGTTLDTFTYTLTPTGSTATVSVTVTCSDDDPTAVDDTATVAENAPATTINVLANDNNADGGPISITSVTQPANGTVVITNGGADLTYQPNAGYCNTPPGTTLDTFTYTLTPGGDTATVSVTVTCSDDEPTAVNDSATVAEDSGANTINVLANDTDPDGGSISIASVTQPANGTVAITNGGADLTYTPNADYCNTPPGTTLDTFTYTLTPGSSSATVTVTVTCGDDNPVAVDDAATVTEDAPATTINVLANDTDNDGGAISITSVTQPANGTVVITNGGADLTYQPNANYCNTPPGTTLDTFTYTLTPGGDSATVTVTVTCEEDDPVAVADAATVAEDSSANAIDVLANDTDVDGGAISVASVTQPANGTVAITGGGTGVSYTPNANYCNTPPGTTLDTFTYTLTPGSSSTTVTVSVTCSDDDPVAVADAATVAEDSGANAIDVLANDTDVDAGPKSVASVTQPANGTVAITGGGTGVSYTPNANYCNTPPGTTLETFTYTLTPGGSSTTVTVTVTCVDDNPTAVADAATVTEDSSNNAIDVLANDTDPDGGAKSVQSVTQPANGTVAITGGGTGVSYTPNANYCNTPPGTTLDTFTYTLTPGGSSTTVSVSVTCVDDNPTAVADSATVLEDSSNNAIDVLANDSDPDAGPKSVSSVTQPANGTVAITGGGTGVSYTPNANYCNTPPGTTLDTFTYTLTPGGSSTTVTVSVTCVDDPPVAVNDSATVNEDSGANAIPVLANDTDPDGGPISITSVTQPANGTVAITGGGTGLTYTPSLNYCNLPPGTAPSTFTYTLTPGGSTATVSVLVQCINDPPVAGTDSWQTFGNTELRVDLAPGTTPHVHDTTPSTFGVLDNDSDPVEGSPVSITGIVGCADITAPYTCATTNGGTVTLEANGRFTYTPAAGSATADSFQYLLTDGEATVNGLVNLTKVEMVWYVDPAGSAGNGTSVSPLNSLTSLNGVGGAGDSDDAADYIFIYAGTLNGSIELETQQRLIGHVEGLTINQALNGNPIVPLVAAGARPLLTNAAGDAVRVTSALPTEIRGLSLSGSLNAIDVTATGAYSGSSTLTITNNVFQSAGAEDVDINANATGTVTFDVTSNTWNAAGTHANNGFDLRTTNGTVRLNFSNNTGILSNMTGVLVDGVGGGTITITGFGNNTVHQNTGGAGVSINAATFDSAPGTAGNQQVAGGTTVVGIAGDGVGGAGVLMTNVQGNLFFTDLDIFASGGAGLRVAGTGSGMTFGVSPSVAIVQATGGPAVDVTSTALTLPLSSLTSTNSPSTGVALNSITGSFSAGSGSTISGITAAATAFQVGNSNATVSYAGTITTTQGKGVDLTTNTGSTISFTGTLNLGSLANTAFNATGGGTVTTTDTASTLTSTTGTALNVVNTTIGAGGLRFRSVSANGAASGIVLNSTGSSGNLVVSGTGSAGSGGHIQNTTSHGVNMTSTLSPSFNNLQISNTAGSGVKGTQVTNFTFTNGTVNNSGTGLGAGESNIAFNASTGGTENNLSGTVTITGNTLTNAYYHGVDILNYNGSLSNVTISGNTLTSSTSTASSQGSAIRLIAFGSASTAASVTQATISNNIITNFPTGDGIQVQGGNAAVGGAGTTLGVAGNASNIVSITGNRIAGQSAANKLGGNGIVAALRGSGQGNFDISGNGTLANPISNVAGIGIATSVFGPMNVTTTMSNNVIVANNTFGSQGILAGIDNHFGLTDAGTLTATITNNNVSGTDGNGIYALSRNSSATLRAKIQNNTVAAPLGGVRPGIRVDSGSASGNTTVCLNISGNTSAGSGGSQGLGLRKQGSVSSTNTFGVNGMAATSSPGVEAFVDGLNPAGGGTLLISATSGFTNCSFP